MTASAGGRDLSQRLSKIETAISRRKTIEFTYYTMERGETEKRKVDPYHLVFRGGQFYLIGHSHERDAVRVFRLSRIQGKVGYASKAEHDFSPPEDFDRRDYGSRADWQLGEIQGTAKIFVRERIAWLIERDFGDYGELRDAQEADGAPGKGKVFETDYASHRELIAWVLRWRQNAAGARRPTTCARRPRRASPCSTTATTTASSRPRSSTGRCATRPAARRSNGRGEAAIRPERFARLVTLAGMLIEAAKKGERLQVAELRERLELTDEELREDIELLNVVNFGGGTYVLYAEILGDEIEVDSEPYGDNFARPARLLPLEAKALVAAIDLFGDHLPQGDLQKRAREDRQGARPRPLRGGARDRLRRRRRRRGRAAASTRRSPTAGCWSSRTTRRTRTSSPTRRVEPYRLRERPRGLVRRVLRPDQRRASATSSSTGSRRPSSPSERFEPRPEVEELAGVEGWMTHGEVPTAQVARVWVSPERARWLREERTVVEELADGAVVVELPYAGKLLAGARDPPRRRRPGRARARGRPRGDRQRDRG